jgi:F0F1-type ATP synthase assembly protein I
MGFIFMVENKQNSVSWWKSGVEIFTQVSGWIVAPIVVALIFGKMLDTHYGTKPIIFLVLAGISFLFSCFGIVRVIRKYIKEMKELSEKKSNEN